MPRTHDYHWAHGFEPECRHCGNWGPDAVADEPCNGYVENLYEHMYGVQASLKGDEYGCVNCFVEEVVRAGEWLPEHQEKVITTGDMPLDVECAQCGCFYGERGWQRQDALDVMDAMTKRGNP